MKPLVIVGAGGHGRVVLDAFRSGPAGPGSSGSGFAGFIDDHGGDLGGTDRLRGDFLTSHRFVVAVGHQQARRDLSQRIRTGGGELATIVHSTAWISPSATIGAGTVVIGGVVVNAGARVGDFCILNTACSIDHDDHLADGVQVCPGARLAGTVTCEEDVFIGTGAIVIPGRRIGARAVVGAGAVVLGDVPADRLVVGCPAAPPGSCASSGRG